MSTEHTGFVLRAGTGYSGRCGREGSNFDADLPGKSASRKIAPSYAFFLATFLAALLATLASRFCFTVFVAFFFTAFFCTSPFAIQYLLEGLGNKDGTPHAVIPYYSPNLKKKSA
jgi:hypothetical protein